MSLYDIMMDLSNFTSIFKEEGNTKFANWCAAQKFDFLRTKIKRNRGDSNHRTSQRQIYVLKDGFKCNNHYHIVDGLLKEIVEIRQTAIYIVVWLLSNSARECDDHFDACPMDGYCILGYCRKSRTTSCKDEVTKSLQNMITGLRSRSLVEHVYVSASCNAKTPISRRDIKKNLILNELSGVNGDAQDMIKELAKKNKVCLVVIDSAGLTTNMSDLELFLREHENLKKIIIDTLAHDNQVHVVECAEEIVKVKSLFRFDGRQTLNHRSKMLPLC
ncbi:uncharacterized protein EV154DRAFT_501738 [Mucor mucedo]|uniref:uncharacterized protein n=1 Tax=Mucor mucedo TaxID=29922 RepID=UPI00221F75DC|nr:uncharacterized protein EV154DRAFT_501738 [Mucor mucedo]KAI7893349.1 hypothetical protein EV154DRAFT_501738 [Mucor mucedo]